MFSVKRQHRHWGPQFRYLGIVRFRLRSALSNFDCIVKGNNQVYRSGIRFFWFLNYTIRMSWDWHEPHLVHFVILVVFNITVVLNSCNSGELLYSLRECKDNSLFPNFVLNEWMNEWIFFMFGSEAFFNSRLSL